MRSPHWSNENARQFHSHKFVTTVSWCHGSVQPAYSAGAALRYKRRGYPNFTPDLSQLNPNFTPDLSQLNPNFTPDLSQPNPNFAPGIARQGDFVCVRVAGGVGSSEGWESLEYPELNADSSSLRLQLPLYGGQHVLAYVRHRKRGRSDVYEGSFLLIYICNFHVLSHLLLIYIYKLHWNLHTMFVCQVISFWFTYVISMS